MTQKENEKKPQFRSAPQEADIFNRRTIRLRRDLIASRFDHHDFLVTEISKRLVDNLKDIKRTFNTVLDINLSDTQIKSMFNNGLVINQDLSSRMLTRKKGLSVQADEEYFPFKNKSFDLILSCLTLHWINDLPGSLSQILHSLKPDGLFLAALIGGETLRELRNALMKADIDIRGGISPHVSPFVDVRDAGTLMQRAGFALPVVSTERIIVTYPDAFALMKELKAMGENNGLLKRDKGLSSKRLMMKAAEYYHDIYGDEGGRIPATFDILYLQGWAPHENQQKPLKPGSAGMSLKDALGAMPPKS